MAKIFISYVREDRPKAEQLARVFEDRGWSVWWDTRLKAGEVWDEVIERELMAAQCVVVLWSRISIGKHWVRAEANEGLQRGILIPALIDNVRPPLPFRLVQAEFLIDWSDDRSDPGLVRLLAAIGNRLDSAEPPTGTPDASFAVFRKIEAVVDDLQRNAGKAAGPMAGGAEPKAGRQGEERSFTRSCYVSYAWDDGTPEGKERLAIVERLCDEAPAKGIKILRDKNEIGLGERISKFMQRLGHGERVIIILSDKYLKSPFCMNELSEVWRNSRQDEEEFLERIRVYTMPDAKIWTLEGRLAYAVYWKNRYGEVEALVKKHGYDILGDKGYQDYRRMKKFAGDVTDLLTTVSDILQPRGFDELVKYGFDDKLPRRDGDGLHPPSIPDFAAFRDIDAPWCPEMVALPAGEFLMGSAASEGGHGKREGPSHPVTIGYRFAIGRYPVTFAEYDHFCTVTQREKPGDEKWSRGRCPVINVSWHDAQAYVAWLAKVTRKPYRLPSEAEWEYACRAGTTTRYAFGNNITEREANLGKNVGATTDVGSYPANPWGLHDMHGNVWEWVEDVWHDSYQGAPTDGSAWTNAEPINSASVRVVRGRSWDNVDPKFRRAPNRSGDRPDRRINNLGFRCARVQS